MGKLIDDKWHDVWYDTASHEGRFVHQDSAFRNRVTAAGSPGATGEGGFKAKHGHYHLYVSLACPRAHRTIIMRKLKGLENMISMSMVNAHTGAEGWMFEPGTGVVPDPINHATKLHGIYTATDPGFTGRVAVPVLWDEKRATIVANESTKIIRMFNSAFDGLGAEPVDYYLQTCGRDRASYPSLV